MEWSELYLFTLIFMRMTGLVVFNPILGRNGLPNLAKAGMIMVFSVFVLNLAPQRPEVPGTVLEFGLQLLLELGVGFNTPTIIRFPFEQMVRENRDWALIRLNLDEAVVPESFGSRAVGINDDIARSLEDIRREAGAESLSIEKAGEKDEE